MKRERTQTAPSATSGNQTLHRKLRIGSPDSPLERQADAVADQVMRMPEPTVQRKCARCQEDEKTLHRKEIGALNSPSVAPPIVHNVLAASGRPLDPVARSFMEPRFGRDFADVRIHIGERAAESADAVNALAYTVGRDVVFAEGQYRPETEEGRRLIAHELGHVVQGKTGTGQQLARQEKDEATEKTSACPVKAKGTLSEVSWGETAGIYPTANNKYQPDKWDPDKTCELLKMRGAVHAVGQRGESVHRGKPKDNDPLEQKLKTYHLTENFPALDPKINDTKVKWFFLSEKSQDMHPGISNEERVKTYGPFYNIGGGDAAKGDIYVHFFKVKNQ